jgi:DNA primase large subunit
MRAEGCWTRELTRPWTRLVLSDVETAGVRNMKGEEMHKFLAERVKKWMPLGSDDKTTELERKKDQYSHFILRLAFCRSYVRVPQLPVTPLTICCREELRVRFLRAEVTLFKVRWEMSTASERRAFVQSLNFGWEVVRISFSLVVFGLSR